MSEHEKPRVLSVTAQHVAELERENAKLRNDLEDANNQAEEVCIENAKLRELVMIAVKYCDSGTCDGCPIQEGESGSCPYSDMARELGVEV